MQNNSGKLSIREKVGYGVGDTASNLFFQVFILFLLYFYTDVFGISAAAAGTMFLVTRINLFNFSFKHSIEEMKELTGGKVTLLGNIPPRDVLKEGTPEEVKEAVLKTVEGLDNTSRLILSSGGGMPQAVTTENINAFIEAAKTCSVFHSDKTQC